MHSVVSKFLAIFSILAAVLFSQAALAGLVVASTAASGAIGADLRPTLTLSSDGNPDEIDLSQVSAWDFQLVWNDPALVFHPNTSTMSVGGVVYNLPDLVAMLGTADVIETSGPGSYAFSWFPADLGTVDLSGGFAFMADFTATAAGHYMVAYGTGGTSSALVDADVNEFAYTGPAMSVAVTSPVPEPATGLLLTAGLVALAAIRRRAA